ncbi:MAG: L-threonylcarbamoyladenylate synthase [Gemmatimonadota bacterium]|nr:L-threonylcarbamoyladenylate synthase [Gemmatimonadota bacterium]
MTSYEGSLREARRHLESGELVIHPTEAVYGLGGFLENGPLTRLRGLKNRSAGGFVVLIPSARSIGDLLGARGRALARAFWPGPLTLVLDDPADRFLPGAKAPDGSVAVRVPAHPLTLRLLREAGRPITSTSANRPGAPPAVTAREAREAVISLGTEPFVLDAGPLPGGAASTLVSLREDCPKLIRQGPLDVLELNEIVRLPLSVPSGGGGGGGGG